MPQIKFNWVDIFFLTILIRIGYVAYKRGFLPEFFRFLALVCALLLTANNYPSLSRFLGKWLKEGNASEIASAVLLFLGSLLIFKVLSVAVSYLVKSENVTALNKIISLLLGITRAALFSSILLIAAIFSPSEYLQKSVKERSFLSPYILKVAPFTYKFAVKFYPGAESDNLLTDFLNK